MSLIASVVLDDGLDRELDYSIPEELLSKVSIGMRVKVPVKTSLRSGTIMGLEHKTSSRVLKNLTEVLADAPFIETSLLKLGEWMAEYYCCSLRRVLRLFLPPPIRRSMEAKTSAIVFPNVEKEELSRLHAAMQVKNPAQARLLQMLSLKPEGIPLSLLLREASRTSYAALLKQNLVRCEHAETRRDPLECVDYLPSHAKSLTPEQQSALDNITSTLDSGGFGVHLLHGITGSGKTEIYLQAIDHALKCGKSAIFLVPEIALTSQTVERIRSRFMTHVALLHHRLSAGEKRDTWHALHSGALRIVLGARSSIFAPLPNLGLIIVDEEHENAYKQTDESPCYHARDVGIMRAKLCGATVVLGSATPSIETYYNATQNKYILSKLESRPHNARIPRVHIIDMRLEAPKQKGNTLFSNPLLQALEKRLEKGEQSLLFLNRRGYHASRLCAACGESVKCPHCDLSLTYHRHDEVLICHLCHYKTTLPSSCPYCDKVEGLKFQGAGTQQVERALHAIFPDARILRLDADTTRKKGSHELVLKQFRSGKADILVGTQMIAKGLHFPNVTFVGALNADSGLHVPDFRSAERVFGLVTQVAGRAGRSDIAGEVFIQTWTPEHPAIRLATQQSCKGYEEFFSSEIEARSLFGYPPFSRLVKIIVSSEQAETAAASLEHMREWLIRELPETFALLPVTPCGHAKIKDLFRYQTIVKGPSCLPVARLLSSETAQRMIPSSVRLFIDCDPISTFF